jgi:hypothetical protein
MDVLAPKVASSKGRISAKRLLPVVGTTGYAGLARISADGAATPNTLILGSPFRLVTDSCGDLAFSRF